LYISVEPVLVQVDWYAGWFYYMWTTDHHQGVHPHGKVQSNIEI